MKLKDIKEIFTTALILSIYAMLFVFLGTVMVVFGEFTYNLLSAWLL